MKINSLILLLSLLLFSCGQKVDSAIDDIPKGQIKTSDLYLYQSSELAEINDSLINNGWTLVDSHHNPNMTEEKFKGSTWYITNGEWVKEENNIYERIKYQNYWEFYDHPNIQMAHDDIALIEYATTNTDSYLFLKKKFMEASFVKTEEIAAGNVIQTQYYDSTHFLGLSSGSNKETKTPIYFIHLRNKRHDEK